VRCRRRGGAGLCPIQHINHDAIANPIMPKPCSGTGLQKDPVIISPYAFNILWQPEYVRKIIPCRRIKAQNKAVARFFSPVGHCFGPIHHHPAIGRVAPDPYADSGCLLRKSRNAQGDPDH
jgi:hypothetical protein